MAQPVKVAVRARPLTEREKKKVSKLTLLLTPRGVRLFDPKGRYSSGGAGPRVQENKEFSYDFCYWSVDAAAPNFASQEKVYDDLGPTLLTGAFSGYNACVLAYGQTGAGKTYTMMGTEDDPGVIPRLCNALFEEIEQRQSPDTSYRVTVSYLEIYNEHIGDLLLASSRKKVEHTLKVREHPASGPYVPDLTSHPVTDCASILKLLKKGNAVRATASTHMNDASSRSHAVFIISFKKACFSENSPSEVASHISLVDLAGSERSNSTGSTGSRLKEGNQINKSLVALGNVISALADQSKSKSKQRTTGHVPYRDSVLTWLLKDSLGGNSLTVMIAAISPSHHNYAETLSTLRYASRAKEIVNQPVVNEDSNVKLIRDLRMEIVHLKSVLTAMQVDSAEGPYPNAVAEQLKNLEKNENLADQLTQEWAGQWRDSSVAIEDVAVKGEGVSVAVDSEVPHLVAINSDLTATGIKLYHLRDGLTRLLSQPTGDKDVALLVDDGEDLEVEISNSAGIVNMNVICGPCFVDGEETVGVRRLQQGQVLLIGNHNVFRYNHPVEAAHLRRESRPYSPHGRHLSRQKSLELSALLVASKGLKTPERTGSIHNIIASDSRGSASLRRRLFDLACNSELANAEVPESTAVCLSSESSPLDVLSLSKDNSQSEATESHSHNFSSDEECVSTDFDSNHHGKPDQVANPGSCSEYSSSLHVERERLLSAAEASDKAHQLLADEVNAALRGISTTDVSQGITCPKGSLAAGDYECGSSWRSTVSLPNARSWAEDVLLFHSCIQTTENSTGGDATPASPSAITTTTSATSNGATLTASQVEELLESQKRTQEELQELLSGANLSGPLSELQSTVVQQNEQLSALLLYVQEHIGQQTLKEDQTTDVCHSLDLKPGSGCSDRVLEQLCSDSLGQEPQVLPLPAEQPADHEDQDTLHNHQQPLTESSDEEPLTQCIGQAQGNASADEGHTQQRQDSSYSVELSAEQCLAMLPTCVSIPSVRLCSKEKFSTYHGFCIQVSIGAFQWSVERRYSEFLAQHLLLQHIPNVSSLRFPPTKWFGNRKDGFVEERRKSLEFYLEVLLLHLIKTKFFRWHVATCQQDLVTQLCVDMPLLDVHFIFPEHRSSTPRQGSVTCVDTS